MKRKRISMKAVPGKKTALKITMGIALALILIGVVNLAVYAFYDRPEYEDYCDEKVIRPPESLEERAAFGAYDICYHYYETAREKYDQNVFYIFVIIGLILAITGLFITHLSFQITGIGAGIILMMEGALRNLQDKIPAFIAFALAFVILAWVVWRKVR